MCLMPFIWHMTFLKVELIVMLHSISRNELKLSDSEYEISTFLG